MRSYRLLWADDELLPADLILLQPLQAPDDPRKAPRDDLDLVRLYRIQYPSQHRISLPTTTYETYHDRARPQPLREPPTHLHAQRPIRRQPKAPEHIDDPLVRRLRVRWHGRRERRDERPARREHFVAERLGIRVRDCVVHELDGCAPSDARDLGGERGREEGAVEDVRRAERGEARGVVRGGGGDDGRELVQARGLDGCMRVPQGGGISSVEEEEERGR